MLNATVIRRTIALALLGLFPIDSALAQWGQVPQAAPLLPNTYAPGYVPNAVPLPQNPVAFRSASINHGRIMQGVPVAAPLNYQPARPRYQPAPMPRFQPRPAPRFSPAQPVYRPNQPRYIKPAPRPRMIQPRRPIQNTPKQLSTDRQKVLNVAMAQLGIRYKWAGNTPKQGFDCSGFTKYSVRHILPNIPRTAAQQSQASQTIQFSQLIPGDFIFFKTSGKSVNHVGIYLGGGKFIHAGSGTGRVTTDRLNKPYWQKRLYKFGRFLP